MSLHYTVIIRSESDPPQFAGLSLTSDPNRWESNKNSLFKVKSGNYRQLGSLELYDGASGDRIARLHAFKFLDKAEGLGVHDETGMSIYWKLDGISEI